jgi:hypothetical protein
MRRPRIDCRALASWVNRRVSVTMPPTITYRPTTRPAAEVGKTSPYPTVADVTTKYHQ